MVSSGAVVVGATTAPTFSVPVTAGSSYLVETAVVTDPVVAVSRRSTGSQATTAKHLGSVQIGLKRQTPLRRSGAAPTRAWPRRSNDVGITADTNTAPGNFDGGDASFSETALTKRRGRPWGRRSPPPG